MGDINIQDHMQQLDMIQSFAVQLMRQRKALDESDGTAVDRQESFNTDMGMAFSAKNDHEEF
jgi:hypothetical protein